MIKNYYYLAAGILAVLFAFTHAWNGQATVLPLLDVKLITTETKTVFFYIWHIITAENLLFGVAFLFMSFHKDLSKVRFTALLIVILMIVRWIVIFVGTLMHNASALQSILVDSLAIFIYVTLIILGMRVKGRHYGE